MTHISIKHKLRKFQVGGIADLYYQQGTSPDSPINLGQYSLVDRNRINPMIPSLQNSTVSGYSNNMSLNPMWQQTIKPSFFRGQGKLNDFTNSKTGSAISSGLQIAASIIPGNDYSGSKRAGLAKGLDAGYDVAMSGVASIPGFGTAAAGLMAAGKLLSKGLDTIGVGTDRMTTADAILDSPFLKLTPVGLANAIGAKKADTFNVNNETNQQIGSAYGDSMNLFNKARNLSGKKFGLLSGGKRRGANKIIGEADREQGIMTNIATKAQDDFLASNNPYLYDRMQINRSGGFKPTAIGKKGMKIFKQEDIDHIRDLLKSKDKTQKFQEGGKMNVIPDGALHAHKHHIELEDITKKGIPVITEKEDGGIVQQAEVEKNEITFTLEVTKELENLMKDGSDEAAIEAGKLLAYEILYNTDDKTGLIDATE